MIIELIAIAAGSACIAALRKPKPPVEITRSRLTSEKVEFHLSRYDLAIAQCEAMVGNGEKSQARLDQLKRERAAWAAIGELQ